MAKTIEDAGCGRAFSVGAGAELAVAIRELASHPEQVAKMGERAYALWAARFQREQALGAWRAVVNKLLVGNNGSGGSVVGKLK
jgi:glycosyltransferase involved in cell wall biosynthesis